MTTVINLFEVIVDDWVRYDRFCSLGGTRRVLVSFEDLGRYPRFFERSLFELGVELEADDEIDDIAGWLPRLDLVSLNFGVFADGRPFSQAKLLRDRFDYRGNIRAHGEVLRDQLSFMQRCGINQFCLAEGEDVELALGAFADISESYQPELVQLEPGPVASPH
jgi:uncharacterized protein (DUF934 family)